MHMHNCIQWRKIKYLLAAHIQRNKKKWKLGGLLFDPTDAQTRIKYHSTTIWTRCIGTPKMNKSNTNDFQQKDRHFTAKCLDRPTEIPKRSGILVMEFHVIGSLLHSSSQTKMVTKGLVTTNYQSHTYKKKSPQTSDKYTLKNN